MLDPRPPEPEAKSSRIRVFVSYDRETESDLYELLAEQASEGASRFEIAARSMSCAATQGLEEARRAIRAADQVVVICGVHTERSERVAEELRIAQEEERPYLLLWGRRALMCTKPATAKSADAMYSWTGEILERQLVTVRRANWTNGQLAELSRNRQARAGGASR